MKKILKFRIDVTGVDYHRIEYIRFYQIGENEYAYNRRTFTTSGQYEKDGVIRYSPFKHMKNLCSILGVSFNDCSVRCTECSI